jgi:predicted phosphohydrolase
MFALRNSLKNRISLQNLRNFITLPTKLKKFQYISDIHLERRRRIPKIIQTSNVLFLPGDIGNPFKELYSDFMKQCSYKYEQTFVVSGNHEYWNKNGIHATDHEIEKIIEPLENVHYLNNKVFEFDDYNIIGCTLWSKLINRPEKMYGDISRVRVGDNRIGFDGLNELHDNDLNWLTKTLDKLKKNKKKSIVLTHHLPSYQLIHPRFLIDKYNGKHEKYASELEHLINDPVTHWLCGHSHSTMTLQINGVYVGVNTYGYPRGGEHKFLKEKTFSVNIP